MNTDVLFKPFQLGKLSLNNRIVMAPMTRSFSPQGIPGANVAEYYRKRAAGGVGLIVTEGTLVNHPAAADDSNCPLFYGDALKGWKVVADKVHSEGGKIVPQLWHVGSMRKPGTGHFPEAISASPSGLVAKDKKKLEPLSNDEIDSLINAYAQGAYDAKTLGFDGVEIHGAHGYLIDQFFWEDTNIRNDRYGGSISQRTQFAVEIIQAIRERCGAEFPVILRFSQWKQQNFESRLANTPEQLAEFLEPLSNAGVDSFHCSQRRFWEPEFEGSTLNLAGWVKKITGKPTISVGSVGLNQDFISSFAGSGAELANIDQLIEKMSNDEFDLIAVGRALIANPDWANKVKSEQFSDLQPFSPEHTKVLM